MTTHSGQSAGTRDEAWPLAAQASSTPSGGSGPSGVRGRPPGSAVSPRASRAAECYGDVCITCSDTAVEVTVLRLLGDALAVVDTGQGEEEVSVALVEAQPGDTILVHAKEAIAIVGS
jgi:hydrogenase expression/formation protein HypC